MQHPKFWLMILSAILGLGFGLFTKDARAAGDVPSSIEALRGFGCDADRKEALETLKDDNASHLGLSDMENLLDRVRKDGMLRSEQDEIRDELSVKNERLQGVAAVQQARARLATIADNTIVRLGLDQQGFVSVDGQRFQVVQSPETKRHILARTYIGKFQELIGFGEWNLVDHRDFLTTSHIDFYDGDGSDASKYAWRIEGATLVHDFQKDKESIRIQGRKLGADGRVTGAREDLPLEEVINRMMTRKDCQIAVSGSDGSPVAGEQSIQSLRRQERSRQRPDSTEHNEERKKPSVNPI